MGMASILVVDDEPTIRQLLRVTIGHEHCVDEASDGVAALERIRLDPPDIMLLDVVMPKLDGLAVCRAARTEPSLKDLGIIIISAYANTGDALAAGADCHLSKPFSPIALLDAVDQLLSRRHKRLPAEGHSMPERR
jgi:CheY-like chemotaxis protein